MKKFNGFEPKKSSGTRGALPAGGYVVKIMGAEEITTDWGAKLLLSFDVEEGEHKGFFANDYSQNDREDKRWRGTHRLSVPSENDGEKDAWKLRAFNNAIWAFEDSNAGYHWDWNEAGLKGKLVGMIFRDKEWEIEQRTGWTTECGAIVSVNDIRQGKWKPLPPRPLKKAAAASADFVEIADDGDLPF